MFRYTVYVYTLTLGRKLDRNLHNFIGSTSPPAVAVSSFSGSVAFFGLLVMANFHHQPSQPGIRNSSEHTRTIRAL